MTAIKPVTSAAPAADAASAAASLRLGDVDHPLSREAYAGERAMARRLDGLPTVSMAEELRHAVRESGRGQMALLADLWRMARGPGRVAPQEYMYYRLWDPALDRDARRRFVGKRAQTVIHRACNPATWYTLAHDKLIFQAAASGFQSAGAETARHLSSDADRGIFAAGARCGRVEGPFAEWSFRSDFRQADRRHVFIGNLGH